MTNRFKDVSVEDIDAFLHENINKNTAYKTKTDVKMFFEWLQQFGVGEQRDFHKISGSEMEGTSNYRNPQILPKSPYFYRNSPRYWVLLN